MGVPQTNDLPLRNVRVADFTWAAAGPFSTLLLASLGAEVIKISSARAMGGFPAQRAADIDRYLNYNKMGITLDLTTPEGSNLARELISVSDLVMENYRPGTMARFGLSYGELVEVKPDVVMVSSSSLGAEGPESRYTGFAPIFATMAGLSHVTGYADGIPTELRLMVDYTVGYTAAYAALVAVYHQRATGRGQYVDLASRDAMAALIGERFLESQLNGPRANPRTGNRDDVMAPHGVYRCRGDDAWITIAVATDDEWRALCRAMGRQDWPEDPRYSDRYARWTNQGDLDRGVEAWTREHTPFEAMERLQRAGVAAVPSYSARDLFEDPHLLERGVSERVKPPSGDGHTVIAAPWLLDGERPGARRHAPYPGEDNPPVFQDLLGLAPERFQELVDQGVIR